MTWVDFDAPAPEAEKLIAAAKPMNAAAGTEPKIRYVGRHLDAAAMSPSRLKFLGLKICARRSAESAGQNIR